MAFLDANGDEDGELVEKVLSKMQNDKVENMLISNHVFSEVVHHLFIGNFYNVIYTAYRKFHLNQKLDQQEEEILGDSNVASKLIGLVGNRELEKLRRSEQVFIPIKDIIKQYKETYRDHSGLSHYYDYTLNTFNKMLNELSDLFGIETRIITSDEDAYFFAQELMKERNLEVNDALHLAVAKIHSADFFATLDADFIHNNNNNNEEQDPSILHVSTRFI
ncbi:type II toxin-antitoxin system VapC family toxin [Lentibacillus sp. Marseille-P4043]|uniref:type II toxin-antitoxin system VapC family toxin n=1 Tax=Lentibacillus sp. Marseille-P4043 TaxID=2040293 RepID=UPI0018F87263|nr:PIN domain-containing protein [Lentibacillus sp. Marseille-P4043]